MLRIMTTTTDAPTDPATGELTTDAKVAIHGEIRTLVGDLRAILDREAAHLKLGRVLDAIEAGLAALHPQTDGAPAAPELPTAQPPIEEQQAETPAVEDATPRVNMETPAESAPVVEA